METVLSGRGTRARFDGERLRIVRGTTTWTVPVRAIASVAATADGAVRVALTGDGSRARHGLGGTVALTGPNTRAADAFAAHVRTALEGIEPAVDGHALVTVDRAGTATGGPGAGSGTSPTAERAVLVTFLLLVYAGALAAVGATGPRPAGEATGTLVVGGLFGIAGGVTLWRVGRRFRTMLVLRSRGIGVVAETAGHVRIWTDGAPLWVFPYLTYRTVDGERCERVPSAVSRWAWGAPSREAEILYDPERPRRAGLPPTFGFVVRTLVLTLVGLAPAAVFTALLLYNTTLTGS